MVNEKYAGFGNKVETLSEMNSDGHWKVTYTITHSKKDKISDEWDERSVTITAHDEKLESAFSSAVISIDTYLNKYNYDLFEVDLDNPEEKLTPKGNGDANYLN